HCVSGVYYYGLSPLVPATFPFQMKLYLNSSLVGGRDAVYFNYSVTSAAGTFGGNYNYAIFNSLVAGANPALTPAPMYVANGFSYDPLGLPDDFEITLGGPGGGSNFDVLVSEDTLMSLQYWNTTSAAYLTVPSAYNVGGETGETSVGVNAAWTQFGSGGFPAACVECAALSNGPSFQYGMWGVGGSDAAGNVLPEVAWASQSHPLLTPNPSNAFIFLAEGDPFTTFVATNWTLYQWAPNMSPTVAFMDLPVGNYSFLMVMADRSAWEGRFTISADTGSFPTEALNLGAVDDTYGVDAPLWAFNATGVAAISSGLDAFGDEILDSNEYAPIGQLPTTSSAGLAGNAAYFPWFGAFNDYGFPVFPGILLVGVSNVDVGSAPSFTVSAPPGASYQLSVQHFGWPETNNLQMSFWSDNSIDLSASTVTGWWPTAAFFGASQSMSNVVFWNTSFSTITGNTFATGGMGLFLYGGDFNVVSDNTFLTGGVPSSPNSLATSAAEFGSIGLVDADWGDASLYGAAAWSLCDVCDTIDNNAFETVVTATSLETDP
ncbi:MAG: thermopsin family protease, partial [Thermoplasmata archaeon]